jgi:hypothetical protein
VRYRSGTNRAFPLARAALFRSTMLLVLLLGIATDGLAQPSAVEPGSRVRLILQPDRIGEHGPRQELRGTVTRITADSVEIRLHRYVDPVAVPAGWIAAMWVSEGPASSWQAARSGFGSGAALGAGLGAVVGAEVAGTTDEPFFRAVLLRAGAYGLSLGATTAIVRAVQPGERWRRVPVRPRVGLASSAFTAGLALAFEF